PSGHFGCLRLCHPLRARDRGLPGLLSSQAPGPKIWRHPGFAAPAGHATVMAGTCAGSPAHEEDQAPASTWLLVTASKDYCVGLPVVSPAGLRAHCPAAL